MGVFIYKAGLSKFGKRKSNIIHLIQEAVFNMKADISDVDAVFIGLMNPEEFTGVGNIASYVLDKLGLYKIPAVRIETASSTGAAVLYYAYAAVKSGIYKNVLVLAAEKMTDMPTKKVTSILSEVIHPAERKTGATMPALAALVTNRFAYENKLKYEELKRLLFYVAEKNHYYGKFNEYAQFRKDIDFDTYMKSKNVAFPLSLYDCAPISDGAAAVYLSSEKGDILVAGIGQGTDKQALCERASITSFESTKAAAFQALQMAGLSPDDIDFAEIHDAFTPFEITGLLDLGLVKKDEILDFYENRKGFNDGSLPINISGGLKARGHPVGASGLAQVAEVFRIMSGFYPAEITPKKCDIALTQSIGGLATNNFVIILKRREKALKNVPVNTDIKTLEKSKNEKVNKVPVVYSFTELFITPDGIESPLNLVIVKRKNKKFLARYKGEFKPKIGMKIKIEKDVKGILNAYPEKSIIKRLKEKISKK
ncbi:thiolase family protein [Deferribacter thermophilus]|uniref:thiolase C-terminal domain-containing protein n=1 Tax=Deferribacter thermophilus TaxID=53573 RepID=UPI003C183A68